MGTLTEKLLWTELLAEQWHRFGLFRSYPLSVITFQKGLSMKVGLWRGDHFHGCTCLPEHIANEPLALMEKDRNGVIQPQRALPNVSKQLLPLHGVSGEKEYIKGQRETTVTRMGRKMRANAL